MEKTRTKRRARPSLVLIVAAAVTPWGTGCERKVESNAPAGLPPSRPAPPVASNKTAPAATPLAVPAGAERALEHALGMRGTAREAVSDVPPPEETISGTITLPAANRGRVARGDVLFLSARRAGGPPGPAAMMAVQKLQADDFPMRFAISGRDAMIPGIPFEGHMSITVRVDKDGDALTRRKGDVYGQVADVAVGAQNVVLALDAVQTEDRTIGSPDAVRQAMVPAGHP